MAKKNNYLELAQRSLRESLPANFVYYGDKPLGTTWASTFEICRDSSDRESAFHRFARGLAEKFPGEYEVARMSHWAVGWTEQLLVRMLDDSGAVTKLGKLCLARCLRKAHRPMYL
jgi:hypothetical protein